MTRIGLAETAPSESFLARRGRTGWVDPEVCRAAHVAHAFRLAPGGPEAEAAGYGGEDGT